MCSGGRSIGGRSECSAELSVAEREALLLQALGQHRDELDCESKLVVLLDVDKFDLIKRLLRNRGVVLYCTRLKQAQTDAERKAVEAEPELSQVVTCRSRAWSSWAFA